ncbi:MAG: hypothetical protein U0Y10_15180 [Spirosomataceae bacterium]
MIEHIKNVQIVCDPLLFTFMKKVFYIVLPLVLVGNLWSCKTQDTATASTKITYAFQLDNEGWTGDFADFPNEPNAVKFYEMVVEHSTLPSPLDTKDGAIKQSGNNHSDDLFMFIKKQITGLEANKTYKVSLQVEFATNASSGGIGVGGSSGESVYVKAGASTVEPIKVLNSSENMFQMNIDKGNQGTDGVNMKLIGNFSSGSSQSTYRLKTLSTSTPIEVKSNANGELWLIVGTDSGYEAVTTIYYNTISVSIQ